VYAWGSNQASDLGTGVGPSTTTPHQISGLSNVTQVSAGNNHALALLSDGTVMAWGDNLDGDLGVGDSTPRPTPVAVRDLDHVVAVSAGCDWSLALLSNGAVMAWGLNTDGELGDGTTTSRDLPVRVQGLPPIRQISAGGNYANDGHAVAVDSSGHVWAWGDNATGQIGDPSAGKKVLRPVEIPGLTDITQASAGGLSSLAVNAQGTMWVWGSAATGELGDASTTMVDQPRLSALDDVRAASAGALGSFALVDKTG
jgi:alpha-tubulin suppressor-like RCC1 family protein